MGIGRTRPLLREAGPRCKGKDDNSRFRNLAIKVNQMCNDQRLFLAIVNLNENGTARACLGVSSVGPKWRKIL